MTHHDDQQQRPASGPGLTDHERETLLATVQDWGDVKIPFAEVVTTVERILAVRGVSSVQADDDLRAAADEFEERIEHVSDEDVDRGGFEVGMDVGLEIAYTEVVRRLRERADRLAASPAPTEDREEDHS